MVSKELPRSFPEEGGRTRKALLSALSRGLSYGANFAVRLLVTPVIIHGLGAELYGAWQIIRQSVGYLAFSDLKPLSAVKLILASRQHDTDFEQKRRLIASSLIVWFCTLPIFLMGGGALVWAAPKFIITDPNFSWDIRIAVALTVINVTLTVPVTLPGTVLLGMNLEYKAMGFRAAAIFVTGLLNALAIWMGLGLPGVVAGTLLGTWIMGLGFYTVAFRELPWFGVAKPKREEVKPFFNFSIWLFVSAISVQLFTASDMILIGFVLGPASAAVYATSKAIITMGSEAIRQLLSAGLPGIGDLVGRKDWDSIRRVHHQMQNTALVATCIIGAGVICFNSSFIGLWVGSQYFADPTTNLLLVLTFLFANINASDYIVVDASLDIKTKTLGTLAAGLISALTSLILLPRLGLVGAAIGSFSGRMVLVFIYPLILAGKFNEPATAYYSRLERPLAVCFLIYALSFLVAPSVEINNWLLLIPLAIISSGIFLITIWRYGIVEYDRNLLVARVPEKYREALRKITKASSLQG